MIKNVVVLLSCLGSILFTGCAGYVLEKEPVKVVTEYAVVPETFKHPKPPPEVKQGWMSMPEAFAEASMLRSELCSLYIMYVELVRFVDWGKTVIDYPDETRCPRKVE